MWRFIEEKILPINKAAGIEIILMPDNSFFINVSIINIKKNAIVSEKAATGLTDMDELALTIDKEIPVAITINGKGVLTKKIIPGVENGNMLTSVLPNANPDNFYYETHQNKNFSVISVIRKETADTIITRLTNMGFKVISLRLGLSPLSSIISFIQPGESKQLDTNNFLISLNGGTEILDFEMRQETLTDNFRMPEYLVASQYIKAANLLSFATSVNLAADNLKSSPVISSKIISKQREEYRFYKILKVGGWAILIAVFAILLFNFLIYNYYFNKNKSLEISQLFVTQQDQKIKALEKEVSRKENFLEQSGWTNTSLTSFYADRIAALTPNEILLTSMHIYPPRNSFSSEAGNNFFKKDTIVVTGICENPVELNQFMNNLKVLPDFKDVTIKNYQYRNENESGSFLMEIIAK